MSSDEQSGAIALLKWLQENGYAATAVSVGDVRIEGLEFPKRDVDLEQSETSGFAPEENPMVPGVLREVFRREMKRAEEHEES